MSCTVFARSRFAGQAGSLESSCPGGCPPVCCAERAPRPARRIADMEATVRGAVFLTPPRASASRAQPTTARAGPLNKSSFGRAPRAASLSLQSNRQHERQLYLGRPGPARVDKSSAFLCFASGGGSPPSGGGNSGGGGGSGDDDWEDEEEFYDDEQDDFLLTINKAGRAMEPVCLPSASPAAPRSVPQLIRTRCAACPAGEQGRCEGGRADPGRYG